MSRLKIVQKFFPKVKTVVDAAHKALIEVSKKDTESKGIKDHNNCAMAVACKRKFKLDGVIISRSMAYLIKGTQARRFKLPESVSREVVSFDRGAGFSPGKYELSAVPPSMQRSNKLGRDRGNTGTKSKRIRHMTINVRSVLSGEEPEE